MRCVHIFQCCGSGSLSIPNTCIFDFFLKFSMSCPKYFNRVSLMRLKKNIMNLQFCGRIRMWLVIVLIRIRIRIWIGIQLESRIRFWNSMKRILIHMTDITYSIPYILYHCFRSGIRWFFNHWIRTRNKFVRILDHRTRITLTAISQRHGSPDPDPPQIIMDPQHSSQHTTFT